MDLDMTAIRRNIVLFALPTTLAVVGLIGMTFSAGYDDHSSALAVMVSGVFRMLFWPFAVLEFVALVWLARNAWQLWRWLNGELEGGCVQCGGTMQHKNGRWSQYSLCNMCGSTRQGWH